MINFHDVLALSLKSSYVHVIITFQSSGVVRTVTAGRMSPAPNSIARADSVGSLEFRAAGVPVGSSRGPSPLTIGMADTIPLAVAFHEIVHSYFRGTDETKYE